MRRYFQGVLRPEKYPNGVSKVPNLPCRARNPLLRRRPQDHLSGFPCLEPGSQTIQSLKRPGMARKHCVTTPEEGSAPLFLQLPAHAALASGRKSTALHLFSCSFHVTAASLTVTAQLKRALVLAKGKRRTILAAIGKDLREHGVSTGTSIYIPKGAR